MDKFEWEERYLVLKKKDIDYLDDKAKDAFWGWVGKALEKLPAPEEPREYLVIEGDWPEYQPARDSIEARMTGKAHGVTEREAELLAALEACKCHLANALHLVRVHAPGHHWLPNIVTGMDEAKAAIAKAKGGAV